MKHIIRPMFPDEYNLLKDFLYEAIFVPKGMESPPRSIVDLPELRMYTENFGKTDDHALIAEVNGQIIGAVWVRIMNDYGHIDNETPSLSISVFKEYRGSGIGTELMKEMLRLLKTKGYQKVSLSVQKENRAVSLYKRLSFQVVKTNEEDYIMIYNLEEENVSACENQRRST